MGICKNKIILFIYGMLLAIMMYSKISTNYFTPDEIFYLFNESMLFDSTVATRYKFVAIFFRFVYDYGGFILLYSINMLFVWYILSLYKKYNNEKLLALMSFCFIFPSIVFYSSSFLRDIYILMLSVLFLVFRYNIRKKKIAWGILFIIGFLKVELAIIIFISILITRVKINPLIFVLLFPFFLLTWYVTLTNPVVMEFYIKTLFKFEPTVFIDSNSVFLGLQKLEPTPLNGVINVILSYFNLFTPFLYTWPDNTGFGFNILMTIDSLLCAICLIMGFLGFSHINYRYSEVYRLSVITILLSIIYGYFMVTPLTSLRMHIHFIPFLLIFLTGSRIKLCRKKF